MRIAAQRCLNGEGLADRSFQESNSSEEDLAGAAGSVNHGVTLQGLTDGLVVG